MKVVTSIKRKDLKPGESIVRRGGKLVRINKANPRRKARQMIIADKSKRRNGHSAKRRGGILRSRNKK